MGLIGVLVHASHDVEAELFSGMKRMVHRLKEASQRRVGH